MFDAIAGHQAPSTKAAAFLLPSEGKILNLTVGIASADLNITSIIGVANNAKQRFLSVSCSIDCFFLFGDTGVTASRTSVAGDDISVFLAAGTIISGLLTEDAASAVPIKIAAIAANSTETGILSIWASSP